MLKLLYMLMQANFAMFDIITITFLLEFLKYGWQIFIRYRIILFTYRILKAVWIHWITRYILFKNFDHTPYVKQWTVITGCTDGIGKAYMIELARRGVRKFVLISRNMNKLQETAKELKKYECETMLFAFDFMADDYNPLIEFLKPIDVGILVNNVGAFVGEWVRFSENIEQDRKIFKTNLKSTEEMTYAILPKMAEKGQGVIVNMASSQYYAPVPRLAAYSASKVAIKYLSDAIRYEYRNKGITVQCLVPFMVATKMVRYDESSVGLKGLLDGGWLVAGKEHFANASTRTIGLVETTAGCIGFDTQMAIIQFLPFDLMRPILMKSYNWHATRMKLNEAKFKSS